MGPAFLRDGGFAEGDPQGSRGRTKRKKKFRSRAFPRDRKNGKPVLFIGHLDVVEALRSDWTTDPFEFIEKDGYFLRPAGTEDMKEADAIPGR